MVRLLEEAHQPHPHLKGAKRAWRDKNSPCQVIRLLCSSRQVDHSVCRMHSALGNLVRCRDTGKHLDSQLSTAERWRS